MADGLAALDAIPRELLPAALTRIAARLLEPVALEPAPTAMTCSIRPRPRGCSASTGGG